MHISNLLNEIYVKIITIWVFIIAFSIYLFKNIYITLFKGEYLESFISKTLKNIFNKKKNHFNVNS